LDASLLNFFQASLHYQFTELDFAERLHQDISQSVLCSDELHFDLTCVFILSNHIVFDVDVHCPVVMNWVLHQRDGRLLVYPKH
jgi:hypothetical protein